MLHAGLDLSRKRLDVCLLDDEGEHLDQLAVSPRPRLPEDPRPLHRGGPPPAGLRGHRVDDRLQGSSTTPSSRGAGRSRSQTPRR